MANMSFVETICIAMYKLYIKCIQYYMYTLNRALSTLIKKDESHGAETVNLSDSKLLI